MKKDKPNQELLGQGFELLRVIKPGDSEGKSEVIMEEGDLKIHEEVLNRKMGDEVERDSLTKQNNHPNTGTNQ